MSQINKRQGCKFCTRTGLPILPVRPAIMSQHDILPLLPDNIHVPVPAQGETAYTLRLMRSGYLNIWDEFGKAWINYFVTEGGFYYPLPENGDVPDDVASGKIKPCIDQPAELAKASLVTLPMMPQGMKNGLFWFAWSEVKWTPAVRKQFEQQTHREQYMQPFDMDTWLNSQQASQSLPLEQLENTVAEYHQHARKSQMRGWSTTLSSRAVDGLITLSYQLASRLTPTASGQQIETTANQELHPNGAMIVLQDPTGILKDLPTLIQYELDKHVYKRPDIERQVMLYGAITSLKAGIRTDFERVYTATTQHNDRLVKGIHEYIFSANEPVTETIYTPGRDSRMATEADANWAKYQLYYDEDAVNDFGLEFQQILAKYNERVVSPRTKLYLDWFQSPILLHYFQQHFDAEDLLSGIAYTAIVSYCITNMSDKKGSLDFFASALTHPLSDTSNLLGRALVLNQNTLAQQIDAATEQQKIEILPLPWAKIVQDLAVNKITLPWAGLADTFAQVIEPQRLASESVIIIYLSRLATATMKTFDNVMGSQKMYAFAVAMGAFQNKEIIRVSVKAKFSHFAKDVSENLIRLSDHNGNLNESEIRRLVHSELKRLKVSGLPMERNHILNYCVDIDIKEMERVRQLPTGKQERALSKLLRLPSDTESANLARWRTSITTGAGKSTLVVGAGGLSIILQSLALLHSADLGDKKTLSDDQLEAQSRFWSGVVAVVSSSVSVFDQAAQRFALLPRLQTLPTYKTLTMVGVYLGAGAGIVAVAFDIFHAIDEYDKNNYGLVAAYTLSALSGVWLIAAILSSTVPIFGTVIAVLIALGTAIFIAYQGQDNLQKWLERCLWRRVPQHIPIEKWPEVYPTMWMEMDEFNRALGQ
ncbi:T6SS effector BTH_I2691 family protein [Providencia sp.]